MAERSTERIGFACAYTPLALIQAAGFAPYRILPMGDWPDQAGQLLHDNLCPHVKRLLDRAMAKDLPDLSGVIFVNSCDAMRRLADAWRKVRPNDRTVLIDLPATADALSVSFFGKEMERLAGILDEWSGCSINAAEIEDSLFQYGQLARLLSDLSNRNRRGALSGGSTRIQELRNLAVTEPVEQTILLLQQALAESPATMNGQSGVPVFVFGNMLPDPAAFALFETCGVHVVGDDFCTGSRMFGEYEPSLSEPNIFRRMAERILSHPPCARTFDPGQPIKIASDIVNQAVACNAQGVIGHTVKFCDPYLARIPMIREALKTANIPFLFLEGDCSLRSIGQQRTRIEAFIEMLR